MQGIGRVAAAMWSHDGYAFLWRDDVITFVSFLAFNWACLSTARRQVLAEYWTRYVRRIPVANDPDEVTPRAQKTMRRCRLALTIMVLVEELAGTVTMFLFFRHPKPDHASFVAVLCLYVILLYEEHVQTTVECHKCDRCVDDVDAAAAARIRAMTDVWLWRDEVITFVSFLSLNWSSLTEHRRQLLAEYWVHYYENVPVETPPSKRAKNALRRCRFILSLLTVVEEFAATVTIFLSFHHPSPQRVSFVAMLAIYVLWLSLETTYDKIVMEVTRASRPAFHITMETLMASSVAAIFALLIYDAATPQDEDDVEYQGYLVAAAVVWIVPLALALAMWAVVLRMFSTCCATTGEYRLHRQRARDG